MTTETLENAVDFPPFTVPATWYRADSMRATVLLLPALGTPAGYYGPMAAALADAGLQVLLPDLPGTGASRPRPSRQADYDYRALAERYVPPLVERARAAAGGGPLVLAGHSLGAQLLSFALLRRLVTADALLTLAGGDIHYRNWRGADRGKVLLIAWLVGGLSRVMAAMPGQYFGLGGPLPRSLMRLWSRTIRSGDYSHVVDIGAGAPAIPGLCLGFEGDFMAPRHSVVGLAGWLDAEVRILPVDFPGNPHAAWARHPGSTVEAMVGWLQSKGVVK